MTLRIALTAIAMALPLPAVAQFAVENLVARVPDGYKIVHRDRQGAVTLTQMVPQREGVDDWTEMLATQTFFGARGVQLEAFQAEMRARGLAGCKEPARFFDIGEGVENGYAFLMWSLACPMTSAGKPEYSWYKAIKGNDSFYLVIQSFRKDPATDVESKWLRYFERVIVCDPRLKAQSCRER